ncbi:hypothetical protein CHCC5022_3105 [Bacillus paralicheniformis]|uniref:Uncharacterized protein n=1 Tax=Bacillus paralicheniformis TaxID=1648923 RepID=A0A7Z0WX14_9BACI|nr:hypothetical protein B4121_2744 [Bacillus paralicheniformis]TWJ54059.1 hypothetical protein CHCC5022_3105 [Bacillus paralicheniformis]TWJ81050.1 hypothetical protein CHCC4186_0358 [Bacillus paralicheniformis]TWK23395.1 hypothetical protein CHCC20372_3802 [Bacillus paralicheniformis]
MRLISWRPIDYLFGIQVKSSDKKSFTKSVWGIDIDKSIA